VPPTLPLILDALCDVLDPELGYDFVGAPRPSCVTHHDITRRRFSRQLVGIVASSRYDSANPRLNAAEKDYDLRGSLCGQRLFADSCSPFCAASSSSIFRSEPCSKSPRVAPWSMR